MHEMEISRLEMLAAEINVIKRQVEQTALMGAIEIGKRLKEAKSQVPYGKWGEWLESHVDYSERKAQDFMALAEGYGRQDPQTLAELSPTKALYLLALPGDEREAFMDAHPVEDMTTRELKAQVDALVEEKSRLQLTIDEMLAAPAPDMETMAALEKEKARNAELTDQAQRARDKAEQLRVDKARLEERQTDAEKEIERLKKSRQTMQHDLDAAEKEAARLREDLERAGQPIIQQVTPPEVTRELETLRAEKINTAAIAGFRAGFENMRTATESMVEALKTMQGEDKARYAAAACKALDMIRGKVVSA